MDPPPARKEEEIADRVEDWLQKCDRLAKHGTQYELPTMYKTVALQKILIGETRRNYGTWKVDGLPYEKLLTKLKDYSRSRRLDGEAKLGKQAVDLNNCQEPSKKSNGRNGRNMVARRRVWRTPSMRSTVSSAISVGKRGI